MYQKCPEAAAMSVPRPEPIPDPDRNAHSKEVKSQSYTQEVGSETWQACTTLTLRYGHPSSSDISVGRKAGSV